MTVIVDTPQATASDYPITGASRVFAVALVLAGGVFQMLEFLLEPQLDSSTERLQWWAQHSVQLQISQAVGLLAVPCMLGGFAFCYRLVREDSRRIAAAAVTLLACAMVGLALIHGIELAAHVAAAAGHRDAALAILDMKQPGIPGVVGFVMFLPTAMLGNVLIAVAMWRSRFVPKLVVVFVIGFALLDFALDQGVISHASSLVMDAMLSWAIVTRYQRSRRLDAETGAH